MNIRSRVAAVITAVVAMGVGATAPAMADSDTNQTVEIKSVALGKCLGVGAPTNAWATLETCTGAANQQWEQIPVDGGKAILRNIGDRSCLTGLGQLVRFECDDEAEDQYWVLSADRLTHARTGEVADSTLYEDGHGVILWDANGSRHQRWQVRVTGTGPAPPADTSGKIIQLKGVSDKLCAGAVGSAAKLETCTGGTGQRFQRVELGEGVVQLRSLVTGTCLRTTSFGSSHVDLLTACASGDAAQQWQIEPDLIGTFRVRNVASGKYLTPLSNTGNITTYARTSLANWQKWELTAV